MFATFLHFQLPFRRIHSEVYLRTSMRNFVLMNCRNQLRLPTRYGIFKNNKRRLVGSIGDVIFIFKYTIVSD